jgi:hypothetical protein
MASCIFKLFKFFQDGHPVHWAWQYKDYHADIKYILPPQGVSKKG